MTHNPYEKWETIIGLEVHVALNTKTKLFSTAPNHFGDSPNTNITVVCTGQPGALPVLNKEAVRKAVQFGCAVNATIPLFSKFDRKSYFYPDNPRNFQITQFDQPIIIGGTITTTVEGKEHSFEIDRAHLEDDAGMLKHFPNYGAIDYNRAGVPLLEIVSKPCIHSAKEAASYAIAIKSIMEYINSSDCNMEQGNLRIDANISVRPKGENTLRNKIEIKNMNSFSNMELALESEKKRQINLYLDNPTTDPFKLIPQATFRWDPDSKSTRLMRQKENADDYRYFPEPDLPPILLTEEYISAIKESLPELPYQRKQRYIEQLNLSKDQAELLIQEKKLADYFEEALTFTTHAKHLCNWICVEFTGKLNEQNLWETPIPPKEVATLVNLINNGTITGKIGKKIVDNLLNTPTKTCSQIIKENPNYQPVTDLKLIETLIKQVISENPTSVADYKSGKTKAFSYLIGQIMKLTKGKADPAIVNKLLKKIIQL
jgi:aspartyl-tRNA(Asn)/glutamyl-tRNA(Gln) amidotransferase subunit B